MVCLLYLYIAISNKFLTIHSDLHYNQLLTKSIANDDTKELDMKIPKYTISEQRINIDKAKMRSSNTQKNEIKEAKHTHSDIWRRYNRGRKKWALNSDIIN